MGGLDTVVVVWKGFGIQVVVLLSFTMQAILVFLADGRRYINNNWLRVIIWSAYVLADPAAIYALGHMTFVSRLPEHHLMALWVPMLLVHLGGQDNITAYAIEDNRLWLRHLQNFGVQVVAAAYALHVSTVLGSQTPLQWACILMFVVGVLKYGERIFALMRASNCASSNLSATSYEEFVFKHNNQQRPAGGVNSAMGSTPTHDRFDFVQIAKLRWIAYTLLDVPKQMFEGPTRYVKIYDAQQLKGEEMLKVVWIQLSMMYDLLYTKAAVVHTTCGWCIRLFSLPATLVALALVMFHLHASSGSGYNRVDVVITYVLLGGALVLEIISVVRAIGSSWTGALLVERKWVHLAGRLLLLAKLVTCAPGSGIGYRTDQGWFTVAYKWGGLGSIGQHNLFKLCARSRKNTSSIIARKLGRDDQWDSMWYSWSMGLTKDLIDGVVLLVSRSKRPHEREVYNSRGRNALLRNQDLLCNQDLLWSVERERERELELDESILVWHIATHLYLTWLRPRVDLSMFPDLDRAAALSNYLFFLLAARPYMLPYPASRYRYVHLCYDVICSPEDILGSIQDQVRDWNGLEIDCRPSSDESLDAGCRLAVQLLTLSLPPETADVKRLVQMICDVWVEMLCYTAYRCNENFHAKHLNDGGELLTAIALFMLYSSSGFIEKDDAGRAADTQTTDENNVV
ncbi:uncharacterized protein [Lolium perenne]|uniref:uncharacterized protein n=1 Tax=Lolium perenne TaxID=4522 RepID=UPI0021EB035A